MTAPVIVTGMHRSGTSMIASMLADSGISMGQRLVPANRHNRRGYYEDADFVKLQRLMLATATEEGKAGWRDWGWTEDEKFDAQCLRAFLPQAQQLVAPRTASAIPWGWKDPRTTLLLDFWAELLPGAQYVLIYRYPWEIVDSIQRLGAPVFSEHPEYAWAIWQFYNRRLLDFHRRHRSRSILLSANRLFTCPERLSHLFTQKLGIALLPARQKVKLDRKLFTALTAVDPMIPFAAMLYPACIELLEELDEEADVSSSGQWSINAGSLKFARSAPQPRLRPEVSVVIPCYNHGHYLVEALISVERHAPEACEVIVVNDGSTEPETNRILAALQGAGYCVLEQHNQGLSAARNHGICQAQGAYILPLDADNRIRPGYIESAAHIFARQPGVGVVYSFRQNFGSHNNLVKVPEFDLLDVLGRNMIDACTLFRKEAWEVCGGYDENLRALEDWELWLNMAKHGWRFHRLDAALFEYRVRENSMVRTLLRSESEMKQQEAYILWKHFDLYRQHIFQIAVERTTYKRRLRYSLSYQILHCLKPVYDRLARPLIRRVRHSVARISHGR
jgi:glycosyltransferase involved in cell wall biosynthesis